MKRYADSPTVRPQLLAAVSLALFALDVAAVAEAESPAEQHDSEAIEVRDCVVRFAREVEVPALASGRVAEVMVAANDAVAEDAPLARLDDRTLLIERRAAELRYESAQAELRDDIERRFAETALAEAEAELDSSRSIYNDVAGAVPMTQLRRMRLAVERGQLEVARAKKRRQQAELEAQLRAADLSAIDQRMSSLQVASPLSGVVLHVRREAGEWVEAGQPLVTVAQVDRLHVHALADSSELAPPRCPGAAVSVHWVDPTTGTPRWLRGRVLSVDPQMLPGGRFRLHAEVANRPEPGAEGQWQLRPGMEVRMKVHLSHSVARRAESDDRPWMKR